MEQAGVTVIGPGAETLARTGDKLQAKKLASECDVPVLPAMAHSTSDMSEIRAFVKEAGYPVMIKAVDGGGGRGIRLVRRDEDLESGVRGATNESPSKTVFLEKAAIDGFHHIEIQVVGDGNEVQHLWERDCSVQRRFQKVVEIAPSLFRNRDLIQKVVDAALRMAKATRYRYLGTVEFLVNEPQNKFYFLEINPRLQVEHTITESISGVDLVQTQLRIAQGFSLADLGLGRPAPPKNHSIQLRICSEDPKRDFSLSTGKITEFSVPSGHGVRVDTHVDMAGPGSVVIGANFDNLLAKVIVTASSWEATVFKARRVVEDTKISGVTTNLDLLRGIVAHDDFLGGHIDTQWLEKNIDSSMKLGENISQSIQKAPATQTAQSSMPNIPTSNLLFRRGDAWSVKLEPLKSSNQQPQQHHIQLKRVLQNDFPSSLSAEVEYTTQSSSAEYRMQISTTNTTASALTSSHRRADTNNPRHIVLPLSGKLIEVMVEPGEMVAENQVVAFVKQMKMELEVRSPRAGRAKWVLEMEDEEEDVAEGILLVELEEELKGKL